MQLLELKFNLTNMMLIRTTSTLRVTCASGGIPLGWGFHGVRQLQQGSSEELLKQVVSRLDALEARVNEALGRGAQQQDPPEQQAPLPSQSKERHGAPSSTASEHVAAATDKVADVMDDAAADAVQKLHPALIRFLNSGYLVSQQQLRQHLMQTEWEGSLRVVAQRKGLADFEQWLAENGEQQGVHVEWKQLQEVYKNPDDLSPLSSSPKARMLAHAMMQQAMLQQQVDTYRACTDTAKQLANVIESGQRTGASTLFGMLRKLLPIPFLR